MVRSELFPFYIARMNQKSNATAAGRVLTVAQFRQRVSQILKSYEQVRPGKEFSFLVALVRGMPARLKKSKERRYGRCGK